MRTSLNYQELVAKYEKLEKSVLEHVRAERTLREEAEKFRAIFEGSVDAILLADAKSGKILDANPAASELLKLSPEQIIGLDQFGIHPLRLRKEAEDGFRRIVQEKVQPHPVETTLLCSDGTEIPVELRAHLVRIDGSRVVYGILRDLSVKKLTEQALNESEDKYRTLVERASDGVAIIQEGRLRYCNVRLAEMGGYSKDELMGHRFSEYLHPDALPNVVECYRRRMAGEEVAETYEAVLRGKNRSHIDAEFNVATIRYDGKPAVLVVVRDISFRKQVEKELAGVQKMESVAALAGGIAHDFNNILTAILTNISMIKDSEDFSNEVHEMLTLVEKASLRAKSLTHSLLTFSKGGTPRKRIFSISRLIRDTVKFALSGSNVACECDISPDLDRVEADEGQIGQVVQNMIINADQAMAEGGKIKVSAVNVRVAEEDPLPVDPGEYIKIAISDQGTGISESHLERIFDPFFTTKEEGKGLGLFSSLSIILNHKGHIHVDSEPGVGTTFEIYLPAVEERRKERGFKRDVSVRGRGRTLLIDDEEIIRRSTGQVLKRLGYEVVTAKDGARGIQQYEKAMKEKRPFDVVIMDLTIPGGMGGRVAITELLELDPGAKVIASSGYSDDEVLNKFKEFGFSGIIMKPYRIEELDEVLQKACDSVDE